MEDIFKSKNTIYTFILNKGNFRGHFIEGTEIVNSLKEKHNLGIMETLILGHAALAAELMASTLKNNEKIKIKIECSGPVKGLSVEADTDGNVRGYIFKNPIPLDKTPENFNTSMIFQAGFITVTRYSQGNKPFSGQVMIEYGSIAEDLANYYLVSEQNNTAFNLSVKFDKEGNVTGAGGLFLQALPEASEEETENMENLIANFPSIGTYLSENNDTISLLMDHFKSSEIEILESKPAAFKCSCSKDRFTRFLSSLSKKEIREILDADTFPLRLTCFNCNTDYSFSSEEITAIDREL